MTYVAGPLDAGYIDADIAVEPLHQQVGYVQDGRWLGRTYIVDTVLFRLYCRQAGDGVGDIPHVHEVAGL